MAENDPPLATFKTITCNTSIPLPKLLAGILRDLRNARPTQHHEVGLSTGALAPAIGCLNKTR